MTKFLQTCKRLWGKWALRWLCGYALVLLCGVGLIYYWRVEYHLGEGMPGFALAMTLAVCGGFTAVFLLVFLAARFLRQRLALKAAVLIALAGLCFAFANPPLQAPDETDHFLRAYSIGSGNFRFEQGEDYPADVDALLWTFGGRRAYEHGDGLIDAFAAYARALAGGGAPNASTNVQQLAAYLPQAAGVALGRLAGAGALACMYLARAANALFYAAACGLAVHLAGRFRAMMIAVMLCPMSLFMAASCSPDGLFLSMAWIFIGACLSDGLTPKRLALLAASFGLAYFIKSTALALLPLLALPPCPPVRLRLGKGRSVNAGRAAVLAVCAAAAFALYQVQAGYVAWASDYAPMAYFDPNIDPAAQLRFILSNPQRYLVVFLYTLCRDQANLFMLGNFGWMDHNISLINCFSPVVLLLAAGASSLEGAREPRRTGWAMAASAALMYGFTYTGMYLTSTPVTLPEINGVQTRYMLTAFFALMVLAAMGMGRTMALHELRPGKPQKTPPAWRVLHCCFLFAIGGALLLVQTYYVGP